MNIQQQWLFIFVGIVMWILAWLPCVVFISRSWRARRNMLFDYFDDASLRLYYRQFFPSEDLTNVDADQLKRKFKIHFHSLYGRRFYLSPIALLAALVGLGIWCLHVFLLSVLTPAAKGGGSVYWVAVSAFLGAYMWVVSDQLGRLRARDFTPVDVYNCVFRFLIAIPMGYCFGKLATESLAVPMAFLLGTFPTTTLFKYGRRIVDQKLNLGEEADERSWELEKLQCVGKSQAERFSDMGITTIGQLAWSNPVDLTFRSNLEFNFIVDSVSQALFWVYAEDSVKDVYKFGLRGAMEVNYLLAAVARNDEPSKQALADAATILKMSPTSAQHMFNEVAHDPYTEFLVNVWH